MPFGALLVEQSLVGVGVGATQHVPGDVGCHLEAGG